MLNRIQQFLEQNILYWFEALSLFRKIREAADILTRLYSLIKVRVFLFYYILTKFNIRLQIVYL